MENNNAVEDKEIPNIQRRTVLSFLFRSKILKHAVLVLVHDVS